MPRRPRPRVETITRRVYFYRCRIHPDDRAKASSFEPAILCSSIGRVLQTPDRYHGIGEGEDVCIWPMSTSSQSRLMMGLSRRKGLPQRERDGQVLPLDLDERDGLLECTHIAFFPDGIAGVEFNFHGPRLSRLSEYMQAKFQDAPRVTFEMLLNQDALRQIEHLKDVCYIQLRMRRDSNLLLREVEAGRLSPLAAMAEDIGADVLEVTFRPRLRSRQSFATGALDLVKSIVGHPTMQEDVDVFKVKGTDDRTWKPEMFDFLRDELASSQQVVQANERYRSVDSDSMFSAISLAYEQLRDSITEAVGVAV